MTDPKMAGKEWVASQLGTFVISAKMLEAFLAGAAWQRERDANLAETLFDRDTKLSLSEEIRAQTCDESPKEGG